MVKAIKPWLIPSYWGFVEKYIADALEHAHGELETSDVHEYLLAERMFLFVAQGKKVYGAATCEVVQYVRKKAIRVVTLGGEDFDSWRNPLNEALTVWGKTIGADRIEAYVRKGLVLQLEQIGYRQTYVGMACEVDNGKEQRVSDNQ